MKQDKSVEMGDAQEVSEVEAKRRKALKRIAATTGIVATMSGEWKKPFLDSAILPAHAEPSDCADGDECAPSDIRLKKNIRKVDSPGLAVQLYRFEYRGNTGRETYVGVMAQHLLGTHPDSVTTGEDGFFRVNYKSLGLKMAYLEEWNRIGIKAVKIH